MTNETEYQRGYREGAEKMREDAAENADSFCITGVDCVAESIRAIPITTPQPAIEGDVVEKVAIALSDFFYSLENQEFGGDQWLDAAKSAIAAMQTAKQQPKNNLTLSCCEEAKAEERARCVKAEDALLSLTKNAVEGDYYESGDPESGLSGYWISADVFDSAYDFADSIETERKIKAIEQGGGDAV